MAQASLVWRQLPTKPFPAARLICFFVVVYDDAWDWSKDVDTLCLCMGRPLQIYAENLIAY